MRHRSKSCGVSSRVEKSGGIQNSAKTSLIWDKREHVCLQKRQRNARRKRNTKNSYQLQKLQNPTTAVIFLCVYLLTCINVESEKSGRLEVFHICDPVWKLPICFNLSALNYPGSWRPRQRVALGAVRSVKTKWLWKRNNVVPAHLPDFLSFGARPINEDALYLQVDAIWGEFASTPWGPSTSLRRLTSCYLIRKFQGRRE